MGDTPAHAQSASDPSPHSSQIPQEICPDQLKSSSEAGKDGNSPLLIDTGFRVVNPLNHITPHRLFTSTIPSNSSYPPPFLLYSALLN